MTLTDIKTSNLHQLRWQIGKKILNYFKFDGKGMGPRTEIDFSQRPNFIFPETRSGNFVDEIATVLTRCDPVCELDATDYRKRVKDLSTASTNAELVVPKDSPSPILPSA
jgi:hypothetical protein